MMGQNYDEVMGRHGDGEKKIILLRVPASPFLRVIYNEACLEVVHGLRI